MIKDEVIDEIRAVRHRISAECGHDIERFFDRLEEVARRHPEQVRRFRELQRQRGMEQMSARVAEEP